MRAIWRLLAQYRDLRLLIGAGLISLTGDWVLSIGLAYYVYDLTGSTLASAGMLLAVFLPSILLSSVAGVLSTGGTARRRCSSPTCCSLSG